MTYTQPTVRELEKMGDHIPPPKFHFGDHVIVYGKEGYIYGMNYTYTGEKLSSSVSVNSQRMEWVYSVVFDKSKPWKRKVGVQEQFLRRYENDNN